MKFFFLGGQEEHAVIGGALGSVNENLLGGVAS
jgi:hypothetical protein